MTSAGYDDRGNQLRGNQVLRYDELSRQIAVDSGKERYLYAGSGERIGRVTSTAPGLSFYTITPCRIRDTRVDPPATPLTPSVPLLVQVTGGACGIPPEAEAVAGNLTATGATAGGFILAQPGGTSGISTSTVSFSAGQTRADNFNLGLSTAGQLSLTASLVAAGSVHAIVDATGYYAYAGAASLETWNVTLRDGSNRLSSDYAVTSFATTRKRNYFYFGNLLVATRDEGPPIAWRFYASDHLGTPRLVTSSTGTMLETHKYKVFGEEIAGTFGLQPLKFAAMERDASSGNDYDHARYQSSTLGRFLSVDSTGGDISVPQSLNGYNYALNNPLKFTDPDGQVPALAIAVGLGAGVIEGGFRAADFALSRSDATTGDYIREFGIGFVAGVGATGAAIAAAIGTRNPFIVGAAAGEVDAVLTQLGERITGQRASLDAVDIAAKTATGAVLGRAAEVLVPRLGGRVPRYFGHRSFRDLLVRRNVNRELRLGLGSAFLASRGFAAVDILRNPSVPAASDVYGPGYANFELFLWGTSGALPQGTVTVEAQICAERPCPR